LAGFALAQTADQPATPTQEAIEQYIQKAVMKGLFRSYFNGGRVNAMTLGAFFDDEVLAAWGISDEQMQQFSDHLENVSEDMDEITESLESLGEGLPERLSDDWEGGEAMIEKIAQLYSEIGEKAGSFTINSITDALDEVLTSEQWQKINESQLANMDEIPFISPEVFDALDLTDAQRQEMATIKKELEPEFEAALDEFVNGMIALQEESEDSPDDPALEKKQAEVVSKGKEFSTKFKIKMFDVLTDGQWERLQKLIDNPPEHAKIFRAKLKEINGETAEPEKTEQTVEKPKKKEKEVWVPGPNSWQPGDAIPEKYRQERQTKGNFPRPKEQSE
jgi:prefoldin subunit 5